MALHEVCVANVNSPIDVHVVAVVARGGELTGTLLGLVRVADIDAAICIGVARAHLHLHRDVSGPAAVIHRRQGDGDCLPRHEWRRNDWPIRERLALAPEKN